MCSFGRRSVSPPWRGPRADTSCRPIRRRTDPAICRWTPHAARTLRSIERHTYSFSKTCLNTKTLKISSMRRASSGLRPRGIGILQPETYRGTRGRGHSREVSRADFCRRGADYAMRLLHRCAYQECSPGRCDSRRDCRDGIHRGGTSRGRCGRQWSPGHAPIRRSERKRLDRLSRVRLGEPPGEPRRDPPGRSLALPGLRKLI